MRAVISPGPRRGTFRVPASKSLAHRLLILAALSGRETTVVCDGISGDIKATAACLRALGSDVTFPGADRVLVRPGSSQPAGQPDLCCGESGSTLRFLLPVAGALAKSGIFRREGRLSERPLSPLSEELAAHGMRIRSEGKALYCEGTLLPGCYTLPGNISSQYISGLLMALPLLHGESVLEITGRVESGAYIAMTEEVLRQAGAVFVKEGSRYRIPGGQQYRLPEVLQVEKDWSGAAVPLCMGAFSRTGVSVSGLAPLSCQGDREVLTFLKQFGAEVQLTGDTVRVSRGHLRGITLDAAEHPDLVPVLSAVAALSEGETRILRAERLRLKESDRLRTVSAMLTALGADIREIGDSLVIRGKARLTGGVTEAFQDHRIAMAAAVAACGACGEVTVSGAECVEKSFPAFWEEMSRMEVER